MTTNNEKQNENQVENNQTTTARILQKNIS